MGLLTWLFGKPKPKKTRSPPRTDVIWFAGDNYFDVKVYGTSHHQDTLETLAGGRKEEGAERRHLAALIPEDGNAEDPHAVRIEIEGHPVGFLHKERSAEYRERLDRLGLSGMAAWCGAKIVGGWDRGEGDRGHFGLRLNLHWPVKRGKVPKSLGG